jgi:hypothetical protein
MDSRPPRTSCFLTFLVWVKEKMRKAVGVVWACLGSPLADLLRSFSQLLGKILTVAWSRSVQQVAQCSRPLRILIDPLVPR